jgi:hypothetical protein
MDLKIARTAQQILTCHLSIFWFPVRDYSMFLAGFNRCRGRRALESRSDLRLIIQVYCSQNNNQLPLSVVLHSTGHVVDGLTLAQARSVFFLLFLLLARMCHNMQRVVPLLEFSLQTGPDECLELLGRLFVVQVQRECLA